MDPFIKFNSILSLYVKPNDIRALSHRWNEPHRQYHSIKHLIDVLKNVESNSMFEYLNVYEKHALLLAAFFHDAIYDPVLKNNEDASIQLFKSFFINDDPRMINTVSSIIDCTKYRKRPYENLYQILWDADNKGFLQGYTILLNNEHLIRKEYSHLSNEQYKKGRLEFLQTCLGTFNVNVDKNIKKLIEYVEKTY